MEITVKIFDKDGTVGYSVEEDTNGVTDSAESQALYWGLLTRMFLDGRFPDADDYLTKNVQAYVEELWEDINEELDNEEDGGMMDEPNTDEEKLNA